MPQIPPPLEGQATGEDPPPKREYHAPELRDVASVVDVTQTTSSPPYSGDGPPGPYTS